MSEAKRWQFELGEYIKQGEPEQIEKSDAWKTAIGLQAVDGLKTSAYLLDTAKAHIEEHSWYFRNALVRANYNDLKNGVHATTKFLEQFFSNLLMGTKYELKNRYMHVDYEEQDNTVQTTKKTTKKTADKLEEIIKENPSISVKEMAAIIGLTTDGVQYHMRKLKASGVIERVGPDKGGYWQVK